MPVRPDQRDRYPDDWDDISLAVREAAGWRCQCDGRCGQRKQHLATDGRCPARRGDPTASRKWKVVITVAHLNHTPEDCRPENLMAMCQACHFNYDIPHHAETRAATREAQLSETMDHLFELESPT